MSHADRFVVLTDAEPVLEDNNDEGRSGYATATSKRTSREPKRLKLQVKELRGEDRADLARSPGYVASAPAMPVRLIQPWARSKATRPPAGPGWGVTAVNAPDVALGKDVVVAVLDTGIDKDHEAFRGVRLTLKNFTDETDRDIDGHGTHCAGVIFGRDVKGVRIGIARGVKRALIGKVLGRNGGSTDSIAAAIEWAVRNGAHVISMSLGIDFPGMVRRLVKRGMPADLATSEALVAFRDTVRVYDHLTRYMESLSGRSALIVAAAGNESRRDERRRWTISCSPPANSEGILAVAAVGRNGRAYKVADFSNTGARVAGPGVDIISAVPRGLAVMSGTSMAAPHVAGVAALWTQKLLASGHFDATDVMARVVSSVKWSGRPSYRDVGGGLVQAP